MTMWDRMADFVEQAYKSPYKHLLKSGHKLGKTHSLGGLINYHFDCFNPGVVITLGASEEAMRDTLWAEVRMQRRRAGLPEAFTGPTKPELWSSPEHWAKLFSPKKFETLHGKHRGNMLVIFDEATSIDRQFFTVMSGMFKPEPGNAWISAYNPTDSSTPIYGEEERGSWRLWQFSSLDHPNIQRQLEYRRQGVELYSDRLPMPNAVSLTQIDQWVKDWTQELDDHTEKLATDFRWRWPDGRVTWHRPQLDWEARCLGVWPSAESSSVWSDSLFKAVVEARAAVPIEKLPEIGCDVAGRSTSGDFTTVHSRWGCLSLGHLERRGIRTTEVTGLLIETARELAKMVNYLRELEGNKRPIAKPEEIAIKVDDDNLGGAVTDELYAAGFNAVPVRAGMAALDPTRYPNKRSELWFVNARRAQRGGMAFSTLGGDGKVVCRLDRESLKRLKVQALAPRWKLDQAGRRVVEPKEETIKRLGRSPDDMDAVNLAYYEIGWDVPSTMEIPVFDSPHLGPKDPREDEERTPQAQRRRRRYGPKI